MVVAFSLCYEVFSLFCVNGVYETKEIERFALRKMEAFSLSTVLKRERKLRKKESRMKCELREKRKTRINQEYKW